MPDDKPGRYSVDRLLARTLALRSARRLVASYMHLCKVVGDKREEQTARAALHQIDEALK